MHDGEDRLSTEELVALVRMLILAGTDTTANLIGSMLHYLLSDRSRWERLRTDRALIPNVIEETLRCDPPLYWVPRDDRRGRRNGRHDDSCRNVGVQCGRTC